MLLGVAGVNEQWKLEGAYRWDCLKPVAVLPKAEL